MALCCCGGFKWICSAQQLHQPQERGGYRHNTSRHHHHHNQHRYHPHTKPIRHLGDTTTHHNNHQHHHNRLSSHYQLCSEQSLALTMGNHHYHHRHHHDDHHKQQQPNDASWLLSVTDGTVAKRQLSNNDVIEVIELKCYSVSANRLVVDADKRCSLTSVPDSLTTTRPLSNFAEGRKYLDGGPRPARMSLVRLCQDPESGRLEQQISIREIGQDGEEDVDDDDNGQPHVFEAKAAMAGDDDGDEKGQLNCGDGRGKENDSGEPVVVDEASVQRRKELKMAERLSMRSFIIIERSDVSGENEASGAAGGDSGYGASESMEHELISSVSIEMVKNDNCNNENNNDNSIENYEDEAQQQVTEAEVAGHMRQKRPSKYVKLKRRFNLKRLFGRNHSASSAGRHQPLASEYTDDDDSGHSHRQDNNHSNHNYCHCHNNGLQHSQSTNGTLATLARPDSIYLYPKRVSEEYALQLSASLSPVSPSEYLFSRRESDPAPVMISYNHGEAKAYAIMLHEELERLGVRTYLDLYEIKNGQDWQDSLNFAILDCRLFVPLITPSYGETLWTSRELKLADVLAKRIVPINFGQRWPPPSLAIQFATVQYVDWLYQAPPVGQPNVRPTHPAPAYRLGCDWPRDSARSIATQIRRLLIHAEAFSWSSASPTTAAGATVSSAPTSAASHLDSSGYESQATPTPPSEQQQQPQQQLKSKSASLGSSSLVSKKKAASPLLREPKETDAMLKFERAARSHRTRNKNDLKLGARSKPEVSVSSNSNSNSPTGSSYGSMATDSPPIVLQPGTPGLVTHCNGHMASAAVVSEDAHSANSTSADTTSTTGKRRKKSIGYQAKKVFGRFRRSLSGSAGTVPLVNENSS